jgi:hypothetical protein
VLGGTSFAITKKGGIYVRNAVAVEFVSITYNVTGARSAVVDTRCGASTAIKKVSAGKGAAALLSVRMASTSIGARHAKQSSKSGSCKVLRIYIAHINVARHS